ncbi:MAG: DUF5305 domain-containing protein [Candidatus Methylarchaceae archaeon HK01B]|nr:DUF5305 domain-containing protein [Candidatus Methylarchaceae archaeon HK01M]MCP8312410.1 DUF5305 domain-containing protein [Candidatus Methylarchaceae archaeon HK02M1]MCP8318645.1 DUF5305 domain-containing protein [Candidatus Methylarchaceae archaeon HK01B]
MVEIIEIDSYSAFYEATGSIKVKSLEDLKKIAEAFGEPFIFKKGSKEYAFFHDTICYYCKE